MIKVLTVYSRVCVNGSSMFQRMKREMYGKNKDRNIKGKVFVIFVFIFKTK